MDPNKKKRGRPRKAAAPLPPSKLYFALAKAPEEVDRKFLFLESIQ